MILEAISSLASGGLFGFVGAAVQKIADYKTKQLEIEDKKNDRAHDLAMKEADAKIMQMEFAGKTQLISIETDGKVEAARFDALAEAVKNESVRYTEGLKPSRAQSWLLFVLDWMRGAVRPSISWYLIGLMTAMWWHVHKINLAYGNALPMETSMSLEIEIVRMVLSMTAGCISFWFLTRTQSSKG